MRLTTLIASCFLFTTLFAQAPIQHFLPASYVSDFSSVDVADNDQGFAVGSCGTVIKTSNGGQDWTVIDSPTDEDLLLIKCRPGTGCNQVFATTNSTLYRSLNGGDSWTSADLPSGGTPKTILFPDDQSVIVSRNTTTLPVSRNNGTSFEGVFTGHAPATPAVFVSPERGFFFSNMTEMITTADGGDTWTSIYDHPRGIRGVDFMDENNGFMYDADGFLFKTTDGGQSWAQISEYASIRFLFRDMDIRSATLIELHTSRGLHRSTDGGLTFTEILNVNSNGSEFGEVSLSSIQRLNDQYWLAGSNTSILHSDDDLMTVANQIGGARTAFNAISAEGDNIYALTFQDGVTRSLNGGESFEVLPPTNFTTGYYIETLNDGRIITSGNGQPKVSSDQGVSFENFIPSSAPAGAYRIVKELDSGRIIAAGEEGIAIYSDDNGLNWSASTHGLMGTVFNLSTIGQTLSLNSGEGFAVSLDGGETWPISQAFPDNIGNQPKFFAITEDTWIISRFPSGALSRTEDAGQTWTDLVDNAATIEPGNNGRLYGINNNNVIFSENFGETWEPATADFCSPFGLVFVDMSFSPEQDKLYVAGRGGRLFSVDVSNVVSSTRNNVLQTKINPFPNPTTGLISLSFPELEAANTVNIQLFSTTGQQIWTRTQTGTPRLELNLSDQPAGVYYIRVSGKDWSGSARVIVAR